MSVFLNGADVQIGKVYKSPGLAFKAGTIYRSPSDGKTYRFCELDSTYTGIVINGMALRGSQASGTSSPSANEAQSAYDGIACISEGAINAVKPSTANAPTYGIWAQIGGLGSGDILSANTALAPGGVATASAGKVQTVETAGNTAQNIDNALDDASQSVGRAIATDDANRIALWADSGVGTSNLNNWFAIAIADASLSGSPSVFDPQLQVGAAANNALITNSSAPTYITDGQATYGLIVTQSAGGLAVGNATDYDTITSLQPVAGTGGNSASLAAGATTVTLGNSSEITPGSNIVLSSPI